MDISSGNISPMNNEKMKQVTFISNSNSKEFSKEYYDKSKSG